MGRHAASGSDGPVEDHGPDAGGRRRTDPADALWGGAAPVTADDRSRPPFDRGEALRRPPAHPVLAPEARAVRVPSGATSRARMADALGPGARPRPPMPPVPPPVAPRTSMAPFAAVPTPAPEREPLRPSATVLDERPPGPSVLRDIPSPAGPPQLSQPVPELPPRPVSSWSEGEHPAPWSTGRGEIRADRSPAGRPEGAPFVERRASRLPMAARPSATPTEMPSYGDWTKPSGPGRVPSAPVPPMPPVPPAPLTSAIPDRDLAGRGGSRADELDDRDDDGYGDRRGFDRADAPYDDARDEDARHDDAGHDSERYGDERYGDARLDDRDDADLPAPMPSAPGPVTGTVVGGRAAQRAERESREAARVAAEAARRRAAGIVDDEPRRPRRLLKGLVAVGAVAAVVMGVYTVATPDTAETSATTPAAPTTEATTAPTDVAEVTAELPPLDTEPSAVEAAPATPVRVPVTVLNATTIDGLAGDISKAIGAKDWETAEPGGYPKSDVAATTVFFTDGDEQQRQAAVQLVEQFPQLQGPTPRFFEVPSAVDAPGLVIVATGDWKP